MAESFAASFAKGTENLLAQQSKQLQNKEDFPPTLPPPLIEETSLRFKKGKQRAMTGLEVAEERERDASRQRRRDEREAAASAVAERALEAQEKQKREEEDELLETEWVGDTQLQLSQLSIPTLDAEDVQHPEWPSSSSDAIVGATDNEDGEEEEDALPSWQLGSQAQPFEISSSSSSSNEADDEPRRSGRVRCVTRTVESQQWQVANGLVPATGSKARARALNRKRKESTKVSQLEPDFGLTE